MAPWEIWTYDFPVEGAHPCVLFSNAARLAHPDFDRVNVLLCRTLRGPLQRELRPTEIILDRVDGLDWETLCRCHRVFTAPRTELQQYRGHVTAERRRAIGRKLIRVLGLYLD